MNCPKCGSRMKLLNLPDEARYNEVHRRKLCVCPKCGYEKEYIGGGKSR
jgi:C4-type Zn-finger protein